MVRNPSNWKGDNSNANNPRRQMRGAVLRGKPLPTWLRNGAEYGEEGLSLEFDACLVELARLRHKFQIWKESTILAADASFTETLLEMTNLLDRRLVAWSTSLPEDWTYKVYLIPDWLPWVSDPSHDNVSYDATIHTYSSIVHATMWNRFRAARLMANDILATLMDPTPRESQQPASLTPQQQAVATIRLLVDEICAAVPYHFGRVGNSGQQLAISNIRNDEEDVQREITAPVAFQILWPLLIAVSVSGVPQRQRRWIKHQLILISTVIGSRELDSYTRRKYAPS